MRTTVGRASRGRTGLPVRHAAPEKAGPAHVRTHAPPNACTHTHTHTNTHSRRPCEEENDERTRERREEARAFFLLLLLDLIFRRPSPHLPLRALCYQRFLLCPIVRRDRPSLSGLAGRPGHARADGQASGRVRDFESRPRGWLHIFFSLSWARSAYYSIGLAHRRSRPVRIDSSSPEHVLFHAN